MTTSRITLYFPRGRTCEVEVTLTEAACVVVHSSVEWDLNNDCPRTLMNEWSISQYPTGHRMFDGIPSKEGAIQCANKFLALKQFVGISIHEFLTTNLTSAEIQEGKNAIVAAYDFILDLRSGLQP